jgi:hypothetical protein
VHPEFAHRQTKAVTFRRKRIEPNCFISLDA